MNSLRSLTLAAIFFAPVLVWADDAPAPAEKPSEKQTEKSADKPARKLKGEFKGHPIAPPPEADPAAGKETPKPPARSPSKTTPSARDSSKPLMIDNRLVEGPQSAKRGKEPASPEPAQSSTPPAPAAVVPITPVDLNGNGEGYWRERAKQAREHLTAAQQTLEAAQLEEKREENDFYAWDDGQYRDNVIKPAWDKSKEQTLKAQDDLTAAQKAVDNLEDDARRAGAYPGWIRE